MADKNSIYFPKIRVNKVNKSSFVISTMENIAKMINFSQYFLNKNKFQSLNKSKSGIINEFIYYMEKLWNKENEQKDFNPSEFIKKIFTLDKKKFSFKEEIDPYIFYDFLLAQLNKELNGYDQEIKSNLEKSLSEYKGNKSLEKFYQDFIKNNNSIISQSLYGIFKISIKCGFCDGQEEIAYKEFNIIDIDINDFCNKMHNEDSSLTKIYLDDCIDYYFSSEHKYTEKSDKCSCGRNNYTVNKKIVKLPTYLVVRINWGEFKDNEGFNCPIEFIKTSYEFLDNIESIQIKKDYFDNVVKNNNEKIEYKLFSIIDYFKEKNRFISKYRLKEEGKKDNWYAIWCNSIGKEIKYYEDKIGYPYLLFYEKI